MPYLTEENRENLRQRDVRKLYTYLCKAFPDFHAEIHWQLADGDRVTTYKKYHGTDEGTYLGVAATNRKIQFETVDVMRVQDGKITDHWGVANLLYLMQQIGGWTPAPGRGCGAMVARDCRLLYPENVNREDIAQACLDQAGWAAKLGSPMDEALLRRMAEDVRAGGPCLAALEPHMPRSRMLAPLLLLAAIHRMVLEGQLPGAARFYPSAGGQADEAALWPHLLEAVPHAAPPACPSRISRPRRQSSVDDENHTTVYETLPPGRSVIIGPLRMKAIAEVPSGR